MRRVLIPAVLTATVTVVAQQSAPEIDSIRKDEMRADLTFLASDAMRGRLTDTPENRLAAEWVAARFERLGLKPVGDGNSYYQKYNLMTSTASVTDTGNQLTVGNAAAASKAGQDFYPLRFSASAGASGELVFVGFGITSPERGYDDYRGDVKGKIVVAIDHEPGETDPNSPFDGIVTAQVSDQLWKTLAAQEKGAAAIFFVSDVHNHQGPGARGQGPGGQGTGRGQGPGTGGQEDAFARGAANYWPAQQPRIPRYMLGAWVERVRIPAIQISPALAASLVEKSGKSLLDLSKGAESLKGSSPLTLGTTATVKTAVERKIIPDRNVVALLEGSDPKLRDEVVIVCAHYDHDGVNGENVLNGADDDGSGTVGVVEIAEAFALAAQKGQRPRRSVLFAAWNSEERGLFGAWAYTESPLLPLAKTVAVLNMDMIGRNEEVPEAGSGRFRGLDQQTAESNNNAVNIIGTTRSASLKEAVERANRGTNLTLRLRYDNNASQLMRRSDHWPFLNRGVPAVWVHTGLHPDYHTPNDDADRINYEKMEKIGRMVYQAAWDLATAPTRPSMGTR